MKTNSSDLIKITVLNPDGNDPAQSFNDFAGEVGNGAHAPINYHAYAACVGGFFENNCDQAINNRHPVILLIRRRLNVVFKAVQQLKKAGIRVAVSFKETGFQQIAHQFQRPDKISLLKQIISLADGCISSTEALVPFYRALSLNPDNIVAFIPTPYPIDDSRWDFSIPIDQRRGIFLGTRDLELGSRNHFHAIVLLKYISEKTNEPVTIINSNGRKGEKIIRSSGFKPDLIHVHKRLPYVEYLKLMAAHKLVFQLDHSFVPGQVAGDALLCGIVCIGGNSSIEEIGFPPSTRGRISQELVDYVISLVRSRELQQALIDETRKSAMAGISFSAVAPKISQYFACL